MAIQQHPLPQDISSYRFRLIGDMTIKQFASLGISIVLAVIAYSFPLPFFFKYPLSFTLLCLGVGMAFVPVQGRSLDVWILAFIKSIYSPTQYSWKRSEEVTADMSIPTGQNGAVQAQTNAPIEIIKSYTPKPTTPTSIPTPPPEPQPAQTQETEEPETTSPTPPPAPGEITIPKPEEPKLPSLEPSVTPSAPSTIPIETSKPIIANFPAKSGTEATPAITSQPAQTSPTPSPDTTQLPIPFTPSTPNTLVGLTLTPEGKILDGVLVEIQKNGLTSRATKSNKLGQFMFARPLENGTYQIIAEKEGFTFTPYSLELTGQVVRPLKIQAE